MGKIRAYDNVVDDVIPLEGVKVRARNWFSWKHDYTDANGNYTIGGFNLNSDVDYDIAWETPAVKIRDGVSITQALTTGPQDVNQQGWDVDIDENAGYTKSNRLAAVHRAAYRYYYKNIYGLKRPHDNHLAQNLVIRYMHQSANQMMLGWFNILAEIQVSGYYSGSGSSGSLRPIHDLYLSTIHEIAHASHVDLRGHWTSFIWVKEEVRESWASAVEWYLGDKEYSELGLDLYAPITWVGTSGFSAKHLQHLTISGGDFDGHNAYTPLFIDMIDRFNQSVEFDNDICEYGGTFDQQNCFVMEPPEGETAFIANNNFYYTPVGVSSCPIANTSFDSGEGACHVMDIPAGASAFVYLNKMYFEPTQDEDYPFDGVWDFTIQNLELNVLDPSNSFDDVLSELKSHKPTHVMDVHLDKYFETYGQY